MEGWIALDGRELRRALDVLNRVVPENQLMSHAALWKEGRDAVLRIAGIEARIPAEGRWPDVVVTYARFFLAEHERLPAEGTICFHREAERIGVGGSSAPCWRRQSATDWPRFIEQPWPFELVDLMELAFTADLRDLEHSGLSHTVRAVISRGKWWLDWAIATYGDELDHEPMWEQEVRHVADAVLRAALDQLDRRTAFRFDV